MIYYDFNYFKLFWLIKKNNRLINNIPAPATPTVAAPAPMYLAAESISLRTADVVIDEACNFKNKKQNYFILNKQEKKKTIF